MMPGPYLLKPWLAALTTIALSSGEAELAGLVKGTTYGLGIRSLAEDVGVDANLHVRTGATAASGIWRRRCLGKVRHLAAADLWIQDKLRAQESSLATTPAPDNPADLFHKLPRQANGEHTQANAQYGYRRWLRRISTPAHSYGYTCSQNLIPHRHRQHSTTLGLRRGLVSGGPTSHIATEVGLRDG